MGNTPNKWNPSPLAVPQMGTQMIDNASLRSGTNRPQFMYPPDSIDIDPDYRNDIARKVTMGTDRLFYETEAQRSIAPFLQRNAVKDARTNVQGRNYLCAPNGDTYYTRAVNIAHRTNVRVQDRLMTYIDGEKMNGPQSPEDAMRFGPKRARVRGDNPYPTPEGTSDQHSRGHFTQPTSAPAMFAQGVGR